jgi:hypothetical protein
MKLYPYNDAEEADWTYFMEEVLPPDIDSDSTEAALRYGKFLEERDEAKANMAIERAEYDRDHGAEP